MLLRTKYGRLWLGFFLVLFLVQCSPQKKSEQKEAKPITTNTPSKTNPTEILNTTTASPDSIPHGLNKPSSRKKKKDNTYTLYQQKIAGFRFEAFPVKEKYNGKAAPLDLVSHEDARLYKKTFTRGLAAGSNFAGKYTLISIPCGERCQENYVLETKTGKVVDKVQSNAGISFRPASRLLIVNPPELTTNYQECGNCEPMIYVLENGLLYKAKLIR